MRAPGAKRKKYSFQTILYLHKNFIFVFRSSFFLQEGKKGVGGRKTRNGSGD